MTNKLVAIINSLKLPKIKKILLYEMKFLLSNYSCLQNPWLGGYLPQIPVLSVLCPQLNLLYPPPKKNSWVCHSVYVRTYVYIYIYTCMMCVCVCVLSCCVFHTNVTINPSYLPERIIRLWSGRKFFAGNPTQFLSVIQPVALSLNRECYLRHVTVLNYLKFYICREVVKGSSFASFI